MQSKRYVVIGVAVGAGLSVGLNLGWDALLPIFLKCCGDPTGAFPLWFINVSNLVVVLITLLPGFIGAWIAATQGLLVGFLIGFIGTIAIIVRGSYWPETDWSDAMVIANTSVWLATHGIASGFTSAAAGATAELLRSNNRLQRTGEG